MEGLFAVILIAFITLFAITKAKSPGQQLLLFIIAFLLFTSLFANPRTRIDFFGNIALSIACLYALLITMWYRDETQNIRVGYALVALFGCGFLAIVLASSYFYPFWNDVAYNEVVREVQKGWWIFAYTEQIKEIVPTNRLLFLFDQTAMIAGLVEELAKLLAVLPLIIIQAIYEKKLILFYAVLCALGFAMIENISYFLTYNDILFIRANPAHAVFSAIWGLGLGAWLAKERSFFYFLWLLIVAMSLHAIWNLFATIDLRLFIFLFLLVSWFGLMFIKLQLQSYQNTDIITKIKDKSKHLDT